MELLACAAPTGALVAAPPAALCVNTPAERWDGYWGEDDRYYARRTRLASGQIDWFCLGDSPAVSAPYAAAGGGGGVADRSGMDVGRYDLDVERRARVLFGRRGPGGAGRRVMLFRVR
jgi:hypothetical protein